LGILHDKVCSWFTPPKSLLEKVEKKEDWETPARGEDVKVGAEAEAKVGDALLATFFGLVGETLDAGLATVADLEMAVEISLVMNPPFKSMNELGTAKVLELVRKFAAENEGFPVAKCLVEKGEADGKWEIPYVIRDDRDGVAVLTIRRPKVLNALSGDVFAQLAAHAEAIDADDSIKGAVLTGFGTKAFVSGADVGFLADIETPEEGIQTSLDSQAAVGRIAAMETPIVCALNGLAFGGGIELAMACHARVSKAGLRVLAGQPEPNLGILPGAGGTQRLPRLVGFEHGARMLRTGRPISSAEAVAIGLVREEVEGDVVAAAMELATKAAAGELTLSRIEDGPLSDVPSTLPDVELGHLSTAVDAIICRAILEGAAMSLDDGLRHEAELFGEVVKTQDMKIGITNFMSNGPRSKAEFVNA
jgi:enoyl-CoA hydratase/carnithine racemase